MFQDDHAGGPSTIADTGRPPMPETPGLASDANAEAPNGSPDESAGIVMPAHPADGGQAQDELTGRDSQEPMAGSAAVSPDVAESVRYLAEIALQLDDPVTGLDEGADALAEALAERDLAISEQRQHEAVMQQMRQAQAADFELAYRHARLHRVGELIDLGYSLDQAVAVTSANEAEVRSRALAAGRNPEAAIYQYAMMHGYRPQVSAVARPQRAAAREGSHSRGSIMERLAEMSDEDFAVATSGENWQRLLQLGHTAA